MILIVKLQLEFYNISQGRLKLKIRTYKATTEVQEVFDAVLWYLYKRS